MQDLARHGHRRRIWPISRPTFATRELAGVIRTGLSEDVAYRYREIDKAKHNEQFWAERFDQVLMFLFGK